MHTAENYIIENNVLTSCLSDRPVAVIPDGVIAIGDNAFKGCLRLTRVILPDSVVSIGDHAFYGCKCLTEILGGAGVTSIGSFAFMFCKSLRKITLPDCLTDIGAYAFAECTQLNAFDAIPFGVTSIGKRTFKGCHSLTRLYMPDSVVSIGDGAFTACIALKSVRLSRSVTHIGPDTFLRCRQLGKIVLPENITDVGERAFSGCRSLEKVTLSAGITKLSTESFRDCAALSEITVPDGTVSIDSYVFRDCMNLKRITLPDSLRSISIDAFQGCQKLSEVYIAPDTLARSSDSLLWKHCVIAYNEQYMSQFCSVMDYCPIFEKSAIEWMLMHFKLYATADYFRKSGRLAEFASIHHTDEAHIWDDILQNYGLDAECRMHWTLAGKVYTAQLEDNRKVSLTAEDGTVLESLPDEGTLPEVYERAASELQSLKENVPAAVSMHVRFLQHDFLYPEPQEPGSWKRMYLGGIPWLTHLAKQVVWQQGANTFILNSEGMPVDAHGNSVVLNESDSIIQAHPMEMTAAVRTAWVDFLAAHKLRQPYLQMLEPVIDRADIRQNRYAAVPLPVRIHYDFENAGIQVKLRYSNEHQMISSLRFETFSRAANHILSALDRKLAEFLFLKDDVSAVQYLDRFTAEGIAELIDLVSRESNCNNASAALLAYKEEHYPDADADIFDAFTLDAW